jgi:putative hemolysin
MTSLTAEAGLAPEAPHIVDQLIAERAVRLSRSPLWPVARPALYGLLGYRKARAMADAVAARGGREALDYAAELLRLEVHARGAERIPRQGRFIAIVNHPTGLADGLPVYQTIKPVRPDLIFFANADAMRVNPRFEEVFIPVEWRESSRTREGTRLTLERAQAALNQERPLIIYPAGRVSRRMRQGFPEDPPWMSSAAALARRHRAPILPIHVSGPPSVLFRALDKVSLELSNITLFHELLNKTGKRFELNIGPPIGWDEVGRDADAFTQALKRYVEIDLGRDPDLPFAAAREGR